MDKYLIDSHKLAYHPERVAKLVDAKRDWSKHKELMPIYAEISTSGACNHRCTFCSVDYIGYKPIFISRDILRSFFSSASTIGLKSVMFAGDGEPLLNPEIIEIVKDAAEVGVDCSFTTNGVRLSQKFIEEAMSNVSWIKVSMNAGASENYEKIHRTGPGDFEKVWDNLSNAVQLRNSRPDIKTTIGIQSLILPDNLSSLDDLAERASESGLDYIVLKPYVHNVYMRQPGYKDIDYDQKIYLETIHRIKNKHESSRFQVISRENALMKLIGAAERYTKCWSTPALWFYISGDGSVYACGAHVGNPQFLLGNINDNDIVEIWRSDARRKCLDFVQDELDLSCCRRTCRMDEANNYLFQLIDGDIEHINFI